MRRNEMKAKRWLGIAAVPMALVIALVLTLTVHHALAQPAPDQPAAPGQMAAPDDDLALLGAHEDGLDGGALEAPDDAPGAGWMGAPGRRGGMGRGMRHEGMGRTIRALDLTADQKKRMADIRDRQQRTQIRSQADMRIAELDLRKLMRADSPDRRAI